MRPTPAWLGRGTLFAAMIGALLIVVFTVAEMVSGGPDSLGAIRLGVVLIVWPTVGSLAAIAFTMLRAPRSPAIPASGILVGLAGWALSSYVYSHGSDPMPAPMAIILAGIPIVLMVGGVGVIRRAIWRPATQAVASLVLAVVLLAMMAPIGIVVACGMFGECL